MTKNDESRGSRAVVEAFYAAMSAGRTEEAIELMTVSAVIEFHGPATIPIAGRFEGREGIRAFFRTVGETFNIEEFAPQEVVAEAHRVVVIGRERSTVRATSGTFDVPWVQVFDVMDGKISRLRDYFETASIVDALST